MLWYKGWLETRFRLLFTLGIATLILVLQYSARNAAPPPGGKSAAFGLVMVGSPTLVLLLCAMLGERESSPSPPFRRRKVSTVPLSSLFPCL